MAVSNINGTGGGPLRLTTSARLRSIVGASWPSIWQSHSQPHWPTIGEPWSARYHIEEEIGHGGSSVVFCALDEMHGSHVAVKVLRPGFGGADADRFALEVHLMRQLVHPHIMPIYDQGIVGSTLFYVMPYLGRVTLRQLQIQAENLTTADALLIVSDLAEAVAHLHAAGFVHRDIKPDNVLMHQGRTILADFGCAAALHQVSWPPITQSGCCPGTPEYMSPEQFWDTDRIGIHSDVYSLACLAFELLAGHTPYVGSDARSIAGRHLTASVPPISARRGPDFCGADAVFTRALAKEPDKRYETAIEFAQALCRALHNAPNA